MKAIKTILGVLAMSSLLGFSAFAQENGNRDENGKVVRGSYVTNSAGSNWFIGLGAGLNGFVTPGSTTVLGYGLDKEHIAAEVFVGKWFTPSVGARLGYSGVSNKFDYTKYTNMAGASREEAGLRAARSGWYQHFVHADLMWNLSNALSGYKETRFWDLIPYAQFGVLEYYFPKLNEAKLNAWDQEFGAGFGLMNDFRLGNRVDLYLDLSTVVARNEVFSNKSDSRYAFMPSAKIGLVFNLGRTNFDRLSSVMPVVVPVPFTTDQYNALKNRVAELEKENAALKNEIEALKNQAPDTVYVGAQGAVESPATLYFDLGSAKLSSRELAHLDFYLENVISKSEKEFTLTGSADNTTGSAKRNQQLSEQRAKFVKDYLVKKGVEESRLVVKAEGDKNQRFSTPALNRVVVIE